jgi:putative FmdB family regulatory protein
MPIYAYKCASCGYAKDVLQKISDPILTVCPNCGQPEFQKQLTAAGFQLKGSGWYVTDFRGGNGSAANKEGSDENKAAANGDVSKDTVKNGKDASGQESRDAKSSNEQSSSGKNSASESSSSTASKAVPAASTPAPSSSASSQTGDR